MTMRFDGTRDGKLLLLMTACTVALGTGIGGAAAQTAPAVPPVNAAQRNTAASISETVIVTGTRSVGRKARDSTSPIDVIPAATLRRSGQPNLADALTRTDTSITVKPYGAGTSSLTAAIRLRGLNPNDVLVLIDGKRRHGTANITSQAGPELGSVAPDLNMIPAAAIDHIEILRDGAAAQYGSDAIAGVVNIITKKTDHGLSASVMTGADAYNGDGWQYQLNADGGAKLLGDGFIHLGAQMYHADHFVAPAYDDRTGKDDNHVVSTPEETRETLSIDFGKPIVEGIDTYGLITYGHRHAEANEIYRVPTILPQVYPGGFTPLETDDENDYAATLGIKGRDFAGFRWDVSTTYGADDLDIGVKNTANVNLYKATGSTPTKVLAQSMRNAQWTNNADISRNFGLFGMPVTIALGAEHRLETYNLGAGDLASYVLGGTQSFAGLLPANAGSWSRDVYSTYLDTDFHPLPQWDIDLAGRFEHYTDFGNDYNGKVSTRYEIVHGVAIRGTVSNGSRAPTLAEEHYSSLNVSPSGASGILAVNSAAAQLLGAVPLKAERSTNFSGGFVLQPLKNLGITVDAYQIDIRDRIVGGGSYNGQAAINAIELTGAQLPPGVVPANVSAEYFSNGASTRTQGLDVNTTYFTDFHQYGTVNWTAGLDLNRTRLRGLGLDTHGRPLLNAQGIGYLTTASPRSKILLNAFWANGRWDINLRQTRYGQTKDDLTYSDSAPAAIRYSNTVFYEFKNSPRWLTDLEVGYEISPRWHLAIGGNNLFNILPRRVPAINAMYQTAHFDNNASQVPMTGGFYYGRLNFVF